MNKIMDTGQVIFIHEKKKHCELEVVFINIQNKFKGHLQSSTNFKQVVSGSLILNVRQGCS